MSGVVKSFGHVGVIVPDMAAARKHWTETLGVPTTEPKELCPGLLICFAEMPNAKIELIQPLTEDSEHGQWLKQHPQGGIHHLCLNTGKLEGAVEEIPCDVAISAIGTNANPFAKMIGDIKLNKWGYIIADEDGRTSDPRIWAGGDIVTGAATVILAMGAGKTAAASITKALVG